MWSLHFVFPFCKQILNVSSPYENLIPSGIGHPGGAVKPVNQARNGREAAPNEPPTKHATNSVGMRLTVVPRKLSSSGARGTLRHS